MLFTIILVNLFFIYYFRSQKYEILIFFDDITINLLFSSNFTSTKDIIRICNPIIRFSKFTLNIKIQEKFEKKIL